MMLLTKFITAKSLAVLYSCLLLNCSGLDVEETNSELELKAVFINCDPHDILEEAEAARRVQREELLTTHGKLDGCLKKIGITVKLVSDPAMSEGEEYIPVEQVVSLGARARLLNPYVLRLRRDRPQQAYPLTLRGIVTVQKQEDMNETGIRRQRDIVFKEGDEWAKGLAYLQQWINNFTKPANTNNSSETLNIITERMNNSCNADGFEKWHRTKRFDDNLIIDNTVHEAKDKHIPNVLSIVHRSKAKRVPVVEEGVGVISVDNRKFTLYDIGEPVVRHTVSVQLFERDTDRDGKTMWSDVTKGDIASVGPQKPEYEGPNLAVHYRSLEWLDRDKFVLPKKPLCLLVSEENEPSAGENSILYLIVPAEDVSGMATMVKRSSNYSKESDDINDNQPSLVTVRISRAWTGSPGDDMTVTSQDGGSFLSLPLAAPLRAQVDLEARADGNQLVYVGKSGRISMAVSDARRAHSSVTLRATNTGLAAARFTAIAKDCSPELPSLLQRSLGSDVVTSGSQLIPPRHTRRYTLVLPGELPAGVTRCKVCLLNHKNESVAIREVALKKGDRCFCVWHCDCVCLTDDPKLLCRALPAPLLSAGGVPHARPRPRKREPPCEAGQPGCLVAMMGAVATVLGLGLLKGVIGIFIRKVAYYKLDVVCSMPRPLNKYQEPWLRSRPVSLDAAGYAVHPDTGLRTVHSMPILSMLMMNTILIPALAFHYLDKCIRYCVQPQGKAGSLMLQPAYNTMDMQTSSLESKKRRRPRCVQRWMSPPAEQLSAELWTKALDPHIDSMGPQLMESFGRQYDVAQSSVDSMVEDPEPGRTDSVIKQQESALNEPAEDDEVAEGRASETQTCLPVRPSATEKERRWRRRAPQDPLCIIS